MAKKKVYAVKTGKKTGIFYTWDECKAQVHGYPNAKYAGFSTEEEANAYLSGNEMTATVDTKSKKSKKSAKESLEEELYATNEMSSQEDNLVIYVDGSSVDVGNDGEKLDYFRYSYGLVVVDHNQIIYENGGEGLNREASTLRNVSGEMLGAMKALQYALNNPNKKRLIIFHDYEGVGAWIKGEWKANNPFVKKYVEFMHSNVGNLELKFYKVKGHSNNPFNERADQMAKKALGIL